MNEINYTIAKCENCNTNTKCIHLKFPLTFELKTFEILCSTCHCEIIRLIKQDEQSQTKNETQKEANGMLRFNEGKTVYTYLYFPFIEEMRLQVSDDNAVTFKSTFDYEIRKNSKHAGGLLETDVATTVSSDMTLIDIGPDEGPNGLAQHGINGWIWFWEPSLAASREQLMESSLIYENESNNVARTRCFSEYPSFTNGIGAINGFRLFMLNTFAAAGSIDLYGIT